VAELTPGQSVDVRLRGELRYGLELARLIADRHFLRPERRRRSPPVLLVPGFIAGDASLAVLQGWLRRRGSRTVAAGMLFNVGCAERAVSRIEGRLRELAERTDRRVAVVGQSRGGELARVLAVRNPELVSKLVMLGSPVLNPLDVGPVVLDSVRWVARLSDFGMPGVFSSACGDGACCATFREQLLAPLPDKIAAVSIYSRTDGIVAWRACLDPFARLVEIDSSHCGMSVNRVVYRVIDELLDDQDQEPLDQPERRPLRLAS
jgi:triacylglycerol lipase